MANVPAGWFPDPSVPGQWRYWDGASWSEPVSPKAADKAPQATSATAPTASTIPPKSTAAPNPAAVVPPNSEHTTAPDPLTSPAANPGPQATALRREVSIGRQSVPVWQLLLAATAALLIVIGGLVAVFQLSSRDTCDKVASMTTVDGSYGYGDYDGTANEYTAEAKEAFADCEDLRTQDGDSGADPLSTLLGATAPQNADPLEFCETYYSETLTAAEVTKQLATIGTPADMNPSERKGFEAYITGLNDEGNALNVDVVQVQVPEELKSEGITFVDYASATCVTLLTD